ncbi:MAG TPA: histidine kinase, partial [Bacillales bacterium]|nr:histidine kinase [Bacillales bacterium]
MGFVNGFRRKFIQTLLFSSLYTAALVFLVFQFWVLLHPNDQNLPLCVLLSLTAFLVAFFSGLFYSFKDNRRLKKRLEDISTHLLVLTRGNLAHRMTDDGNDEIADISAGLNELAGKIQKQVDSLQKLANEKAVLAEQASAAAAIEERQRLARDLHDAVSQQLFALSMMSSASVKLIDRDVDEAKRQMKEVAETAAKAQGEMRALLLHLRPVHLSGDTLVSGIRKLVEELQNRSGISFQADIQS